jgi:hypothetical protein
MMKRGVDPADLADKLLLGALQQKAGTPSEKLQALRTNPQSTGAYRTWMDRFVIPLLERVGHKRTYEKRAGLLPFDADRGRLWIAQGAADLSGDRGRAIRCQPGMEQWNYGKRSSHG